MKSLSADLQCKCDNPNCRRSFNVSQFESVIACPWCKLIVLLRQQVVGKDEEEEMNRPRAAVDQISIRTVEETHIAGIVECLLGYKTATTVMLSKDERVN